MKRIASIFWPAAMLAGLAACTLNPLGGLEEGMQRMKGRPAPELFSKMGFPDQEGTVAGRKYYLYQRSVRLPGFNPGSPDIRGECRIRFFVDDKETIVGADYDGNLAGCEPYVTRLRS